MTNLAERFTWYPGDIVVKPKVRKKPEKKSRRPLTAIEQKIDLKAISDAFDQGEQDLVEQLKKLRLDLLEAALTGVIDLSPADYHTLIVEIPPNATVKLRDELLRIYDQGRQLVLDELEEQGADNLDLMEDIDQDDLDWLDEMSDITAARVANDVQARVIGEVTALAILGLASAVIYQRVKADLEAASTAYLNGTAAGAGHAALNAGRTAEGNHYSDLIDNVYYSSVLDEATCGPCETADGETGPSAAAITPVPNPDCEGGPRCRCIHVYVLTEEKSLKYSPDQPRDDHGRWTDGGGSTEDSGRKFTSDDEGYGWHEKGPVREWALGLNQEDSNVLDNYASFSYGDINNTLRGTPPMKTFERPATEEETARIVANEYKPIDLGNGRVLQMGGYRPRVEWRGVDTERVAQVTEMAKQIDDIIANRGVVLSEPVEVTRAAYLPGISVNEMEQKAGSEHLEKGFTSTFLGPAGGRATRNGYLLYGIAESKYKRYDGDTERLEIGTAAKFEIVLPTGTHVASIEAARRTYFSRYTGKHHLDDPDHRSESEVLLGSGARFQVMSVDRQDDLKTQGGNAIPYVAVRMRYVGGGSSQGR